MGEKNSGLIDKTRQLAFLWVAVLTGPLERDPRPLERDPFLFIFYYFLSKKAGKIFLKLLYANV